MVTFFGPQCTLKSKMLSVYSIYYTHFRIVSCTLFDLRAALGSGF